MNTFEKGSETQEEGRALLVWLKEASVNVREACAAAELREDGTWQGTAVLLGQPVGFGWATKERPIAWFRLFGTDAAGRAISVVPFTSSSGWELWFVDGVHTVKPVNSSDRWQRLQRFVLALKAGVQAPGSLAP
jgi:hypothetical protein